MKRSYIVTVGSATHTVCLGPGAAAVTVDGVPVDASVEYVGSRVVIGSVNGALLRGPYARTKNGFMVLLDGESFDVQVHSGTPGRAGQSSRRGAGGAEVRAPMPALVTRIEVSPGDTVNEGQGLVVLEAMKMENEIKAHRAGKIREVPAVQGRAVEKGELLVIFEEEQKP